MSDDDEDWFERARRDVADDESEASDDGDESGRDDEAAATEASDEATTSDDPFGGATGGDPFGGTDGSESGPDPDSNGESDDGAFEDGAGAEDDPFGSVPESDAGPEPDDGDSLGDGTGAAFGDDDPFGGATGDDDGAGVASAGDGADPLSGEFDDGPFSAAETGASAGAGGGANRPLDDGGFGLGDDAVPAGAEEFGFGGGGGGGSGTFDDAEFDSDIDRIEVGIEGLDEMVLGGVPERSLMVAIGSAGTGKTTFGLQFLDRALRDGGKGVYITLEESREAIFSTAEEKGWQFREHADDGRLAVVALDPIEMANSLSSIRNDLSRLIEEFDADRLVLDSVSLLEMMYDDPATRRGEVFDFARSLKEAGVTTMLTSEADPDNAYTSRYGIVEYLVDAVFVLQYVRPSDFRETRLAVEIQKIRDANHSRETKPYEITDDGISVYRQANIF